MTRTDIFKRVVDALKTLQGDSGRELDNVIGATKPIGDLAGFDSHAGLELTCAVEVAVDIKIPLKENLCVDDTENRARTVDEIVDRIVELQEGG